ncbi:MAG: haloacid dehalogenase type II [Pseudomonadota bacterium]
MKQAFIFDVFGTLVDWRMGVAAVAGRFFSERKVTVDPYAFAVFWRSRYQPAMDRIRTGRRSYVALDRLHRENLDETITHFDLDAVFDTAARDAFNHAWEQLPAWPDVLPGLEALRPYGLLAPCSNGSIALMSRLARFTGIEWDAIVGADIAQDYKPEARVYLASCAALGLPPECVTMVAAHNDDLTAARQAGLKTAFIPRPMEHGGRRSTDAEPTEDWDFVVDRIGGLAVRHGPATVSARRP